MKVELLRTCLTIVVIGVMSLISSSVLATASDGAVSSDVSAVRKGKLSNGMRYYILSTDAYGSALSIRFETRVGALMQSADEPEVAHLIEHILAARPSASLPVAESQIDQIAALGGTRGNGFGAWTSGDKTSFVISLPKASKELFPKLLSVASGWARGAPPNDIEVKREARAVIEERRRIGGIFGDLERVARVPELFSATVGLHFPDILGKISVSEVSPDKVRSFYAKWYRPDLQTLAVVGDIDIDEAERLINEKFGSVPSSHQNSELLRQLVSPSKINISKYGVRSRECRITLTSHFEAPPSLRGDIQRQQVARLIASSVIDAKFSGISQEYGGVQFLEVSYANDEIPSEVISAQISVKAHACDVAPAVIRLESLLADLASNGISPEELQFAIQKVNRETGDASPGPGSVASTLLQLGESGIAFQGGRPALRERGLDLGAETRSIIGEVFANWGKAKSRSMFLFGPPQVMQKISDASISEWMAAGRQTRFEIAKTAVDIKLPELPQKGATAIATKRGLVTMLEYPQRKIKVLLLPAAEGAKTIEIRAARAGGLGRFRSDEQNKIVRAMEIANFSGTRMLDRFALQRLALERGIDASFSITTDQELFGGRAPTGSMHDLLSVILLNTDSASRNPRALEAWRAEENLRLLLPDARRPREEFEDFLRFRLGGPPFYPGVAPAVDPYEALNLYDRIFTRADGYVIAVRGHFDHVEAAQLLSRFVGALPRGRPAYPTYTVEPTHNTASDYQSATLFAGADLGSVFMVSSGTYCQDHKTALLVLSRLLETRLTNRLRGKEGGTYAVSVLAGMSARNRKLQIAISFDCDPARCNQLAQATTEELQRIIDEPATTSEIDDAIHEVTGSRTFFDMTDRPLWELLDQYIASGRLEERSADLILTPEVLRRVSQRYIAPQTFRTLMLAPE